MKTNKVYKQIGMSVSLGFCSINASCGKEIIIEDGDNEEELLGLLSDELKLEMYMELGQLLSSASDRDAKPYKELFEWLTKEIETLEGEDK